MKKERKVLSITIVSLNKHQGVENLKSGKIQLIPEPDNAKDPDAIQVFADDELAGYIANTPQTTADGTHSATTLKKELEKFDVKEINQVCEIEDDNRWRTHVAKVSLVEKEKQAENEKEEENTIATFVLEGSQSIFPERLNALDELKNNKKVEVILKETERGIEAFTKNGSLGSIKAKHESYESLKSLVEMTAITASLNEKSSLRKLTIDVNLDKTNTIFKSEIERIVADGILSETEVEERISYLEKVVKLPEKHIRKLLESIEKISDEDKGRITNPTTKFVDYNEYLKDSIIMTLRGKYLRYVGGKATGKNTAAETLAWLFNRPVGEVAINEGIDKVDITGSRVLETDEKGNLVMPFDLSTFARGLERGWCLIVDEVNTANASLLTIFHGLDTRRRLDIPGYGTIKVHPKAMVILTMNEDYVGTMPLNEATADRFTPVVFDDAADIRHILKAAVPKVDPRSLETCQHFYEILQNLYTDGKISSYPISIRGFVDALELEEDMGLQRAIKRNVVDKGVDKEERVSLEEQLNLLFN